ncbi:MAG: acyltransferase [Elusimicrobiota bacterium]
MSATGATLRFQHNPALDGLRALAVLLVIWQHSHTATLLYRKTGFFIGGFIGVDVFFVLSGFLISSILILEIKATGRIEYRNFYVRRALGLIPALMLGLALFLVPRCVFQPELRSSLLRDIAYAATYTTNIPRTLARFLSPDTQPFYFAHTWSLAIEEQFYLAFPLFLFGAYRRRLRFFSGAAALRLLVLPCIALPLSFLLFREGAYDFPVWRIGQFGLGLYAGLIYLNLRHPDAFASDPIYGAPAGVAAHVRTALSAPAARWLTGTAILISACVCRSGRPEMYVIGFPIVSLAAAAMILQVALAGISGGSGMFASPVMTYLGRISYGLYVFTFPIWQITEGCFRKETVNGGAALLRALAGDTVLLAATTAVAALSFHFVETPFLRWKRNFT